MRFRLACTMDAANANEVLSRFHAMLAVTGVDVDDVSVKLIDLPTKDDIKFLAEADVPTEMEYPLLDELLEFLMENKQSDD